MDLRATPIKTKLTLLLMGTSSLAVLLVSLLFYVLLGRQYQDIYHRDLRNLADILGHNCTAALLFNVPEDAETVLHSVDSRDSIAAIRLYDQNHKQFASYENRSVVGRGENTTSDNASAESSYLRLDHAITLKDGTHIGSLVLFDDVHEIAITKRQGGYILASSASVALIVAFSVAAFLQRRISEPLATLTSAVQRLAEGDLAAWRDVGSQRSDELGKLSAAFVNMGRRLEDSYVELSGYSQTLEQRVAERTEELQQAMARLTESQSQLVQSEKMAALGHLVSGVAHEINNNINFISCALPSIARQTGKLAGQLIKGNPSTLQAEANEAVQIIERLLNNAEEGVRRTAKIVSDLRTFAYPSQGHLSQVDIHQELDLVLALLHFELAGRIEVQRHFAPGLPLFSCLRDHMNQVYMNILRNSIQAIEDTGRIEITTWLQDGIIHIRISDSGCGIPDSAMSRIFDPFFTTKDVGKGTGLGLAISYGIVKKHHGEIRVESTGPEGTAFLLRLPVQGEHFPDVAALAVIQDTERRGEQC